MSLPSYCNQRAIVGRVPAATELQRATDQMERSGLWLYPRGLDWFRHLFICEIRQLERDLRRAASLGTATDVAVAHAILGSRPRSCAWCRPSRVDRSRFSHPAPDGGCRWTVPVAAVL